MKITYKSQHTVLVLLFISMLLIITYMTFFPPEEEVQDYSKVPSYISNP